MSNNPLTLIEALCVIQHGWGVNEAEKKLYFEAETLISKETQRIRFEYKKQLIEQTSNDD